METYQSLINGITEILNHKGRNKKNYNSQQEFLFFISELKQNYKIELSKKFLFSLFNSSISIKQQRKKLRNLLRNVETERHLNYKRTLDFMKYRTDIIEYGLNKWGKVCVKNIRVQNIGKEFINTQKEILTFIKA